MKKYKEFWLQGWIADSQEVPLEEPDTIHVIEKEAYDELRDAVKRYFLSSKFHPEKEFKEVMKLIK